MRSGLDRSALLVVLLGLAGLAVGLYLTLVHYAGAPLACTQTSLIDCEAVTTSSYSLVPGTDVPVSVPGMAWSLLTAAIGALQLRGPRRGLDALLAVSSGLALVGVLYFVRAEIVVIGRICLWCTAFHVIVLATLIVALVRLQRAPEDV